MGQKSRTKKFLCKPEVMVNMAPNYLHLSDAKILSGRVFKLKVVSPVSIGFSNL